MILAETVSSSGDSGADLWGLPHAVKSGRQGGGRVFVETYLSVIYHTTTPPPTFFHWLVCELGTSHGGNIMDNVAGEYTRARG